MPTCSHHESPVPQDNMKEVIYSEGEESEGYLYPNKTWDSDGSPKPGWR